MRSVIRVPNTKPIFEVIEALETVTQAEVIEISTYLTWYSITIEHRNNQSCPMCGAPIHEYGHGLCASCWAGVKGQIDALS